MGIWDDQHIEPLARIARFVTVQGAVAGIQLAHAGRKGQLRPALEGWGQAQDPRGRGLDGRRTEPDPLLRGRSASRCRSMRRVSTASSPPSKPRAHRALAAGFRLIEIHSAHGYLLHEFLSPLSNHRHDQYGGSLENRMRLVLRVAERLRKLMPENCRSSCGSRRPTGRPAAGTSINRSSLPDGSVKLGVDLIDVSSGALVPKARIPVARGYQVPFARQIRDEAGIMTGAVGMITETAQANEIITGGDADLVFLARELLRQPYWALRAEQELGVEPTWPIQYGYAVRRRAT